MPYRQIYEKNPQTCNNVLWTTALVKHNDIDVNHNYYFPRNHTIFPTFVIQYTNLDMLSSLRDPYEKNFPRVEFNKDYIHTYILYWLVPTEHILSCT